MPIADRYTVLALMIDWSTARRVPRQIETAVANDRIEYLRRALEDECGGSVLVMLGAEGGTLLLADDETGDHHSHRLFEFVSRTTVGTPTAVATTVSASEIHQATELTHELLDVVRRLHYRPGMYAAEMLALEYQLTRPGPGNSQLRALLQPILDHRDLLRTLRVHLVNRGSTGTARALKVHISTVVKRLHRIRALTGLDPFQHAGLWYLQSALIAHDYCANHYVADDRSAAQVRK